LRVKLKDGQVLIDCGFFVSWPVVKEELKSLNLTEEMSYTYAATIDRVIDGDTLLALIEVGFGIIVRDRLRLRGINAPETGTPAGDRAKKFMEKLLPAGATVVIKSHKWKTDAHGRFVADVFCKEGVEDARDILKDGAYLNQELLDSGHAVRMAE
jgi:endonuclease YncB( thermonuclease family)